MTELIFASGNQGKVKEVTKLFSDYGIKIISLKDLQEVPEIIEDGNTFEENAFIKAKIIFDKFNKPVIADDSGLEVAQLNNEPGIYSARFAGENCTYADNNKKVLNELEKYDEPHFAKFICCAVYFNGNDKIVSIGELNGKIIKKETGKNGFGYDPIFMPINYNITLAEMNLEIKNGISHRGIAFKKLKEKMIERNIL